MPFNISGVTWNTPTGEVVSGGTSYVNAGDTVTITYTYTSTGQQLNAPLASTDYIVLSNGDKAFLTSSSTVNGSGTAVFSYVIPSNASNTTSLGLASTTIYLANGTKDNNVNSYSPASSNPSQVIVVDTTAPTTTAAIGSVTDDVEPVTTTSLANGSSTNDTQLTLTGTLSTSLVTGESVKIYDGTTLVATATVTGTSWTATTSVLSSGSHSLKVVVEDTAGNQGTASSAFNVTIDTTPPAQPSVDTVDTLLSAADVVDNETYTFTAEANSTVVVSFVGTSGTPLNLTATPTVSGGTTYTVTLTAAQLNSLGQGTVNYSAIATDAAGNASTAKTGSFTIDTTAPTVTGSTADTGTFHVGETATFTLSGSEDMLAVGSSLDLSNGATATYVSGSGTGTLVYKYTVASGNPESADVGITSVNGVTDLAGNPLTFSGNPDGTTQIICFYPGTLVATPDGQRAVETLAADDLVLTAEGEAKPIRWMGRQTVSRVFGDPLKTLPIRIAAGALGENLPVRDLLVSPAHALALDGVLIQAGALVNGISITREGNVPATFTYYHIELADQSLILAEGVAAETFIDNASREAFDNWEEHPAVEAPMAELALPRAMAHRQVPMATRQRIAARAAALFPQESAAA